MNKLGKKRQIFASCPFTWDNWGENGGIWDIVIPNKGYFLIKTGDNNLTLVIYYGYLMYCVDSIQVEETYYSTVLQYTVATVRVPGRSAVLAVV